MVDCGRPERVENQRNENCAFNPLTARHEKNNPYAMGFLVKIKFFLIIYARDKIFLSPGTNIL